MSLGISKVEKGAGMARLSSDVDCHLGERLRSLRQEVGLSQTDVAAALGISFQQLQKYETGANRVAAGRLWDIANVLEVDLEYFFEGFESSRRPLRSMRIPGTGSKRAPPKKRRGKIRH